MPPFLATGLFWVSVACCAVAQLFIIRSIRGARHLAQPAPTVPRSRGAVEMLWAVLPAIGLGVLLFYTWHAVRASNDASAPRAPVAAMTR